MVSWGVAVVWRTTARRDDIISVNQGGREAGVWEACAGCQMIALCGGPTMTLTHTHTHTHTHTGTHTLSYTHTHTQTPCWCGVGKWVLGLSS